MIRCEWSLVTGPATEPLTLAEAKQQARVPADLGDEDGLIVSYIKASREAAEAHMARGLFTQTWLLTLSAFADIVWLPMAAPLQSITSVKYYDTAGALQTLATSVYDFDTVSRPGTLVRKSNQTWPALQSDRNVGKVEITYVVGWDDVTKIPEIIKQGCRLYVTYAHCDRHGLPGAADAKAAAEACWDRAGVVYWKPPACAYDQMPYALTSY